MSKTVDSRVVEMQFDNSQFERNVSTTMSTLDKLKRSLKFDDSSKGLDNLSKAAKNVDMNGLGNAVENVRMRFSALEVMGVTALANITNSAVNAGKRIVSALTIDPVKSGLNEYETKMGSIQTILANTEHQGTTMDDVTAALDKLNLYADKTIYNFQEMTRNIGTFTAAGVDLETSVKSIQGIANLAAVSGSTSQQASTAMYQLSQALSTGTVRLQDWNSVVNAGMGGKVFQNALIRTAAMLDGAANDVEAWQKKNVDSFGSFRDSLTQGAWLTTDVLTKTLEQFTMAAEEGSEEWNNFKKELMDMGYAEAQAEEILKMANTATDAATKVKTFTQLFDTLKESAQSGWAQTWELIFGDFEEAKEFFTGLSDSIGGFLNIMSEWRNGIVGSAFDSNWDKLVDKLGKAEIKTSEYEEKIREVMKTHGETDDSIDELISNYGSLVKAIKAGAVSTDILKEALSKLGISSSESSEGIAGFVEGLEKIERILGFGSVGDDVKNLQTALEELGYSVGECSIDGIIGPDTTKAIKEFQEAAGLAVDGIAGPDTLAALKTAGKEIDDLGKSVDDADVSYNDLIDNITEKGGRELFLEGFTNIIGAIVDVLKILGKAWSNIFPAENIQVKLFRAIEGFSKFAASLRLFTEVTDDAGNVSTKLTDTGEKILKTFKGLLAILDVASTILGGGFKIALKVISSILSYFNLDILDLTAYVGDAAVKFRDWFDSIFDISGVLDAIVPFISRIATGIGDLINKVKNSKAFARFSEYLHNVASSLSELFSGISNTSEFENLVSVLKSAGEAIGEWFDTLGESENIPRDIILGLIKGIKDGVPDIVAAMFDLGKSIIIGICDALGIHSPSKEMETVGDNIIAGLVQGIQNGASSLWESIKNVVLNVIEWIKGFDFGAILAGVVGVGIVVAFNKIGNALEGFGSIGEGIGNILGNTAKVVKSFSKVLNGMAWKLKAEAIKDFAIALGILVAAIIALAYVCGRDEFNVLEAVFVIAALSAVLIGIAAATDRMSKSAATIDKNGVKISNLTNGLIGIGIAILLVALTVKMIGKMDPETAERGFLGLAGVIGAIALVLAACKVFVTGDIAENMDKVGKTVFKISVAMLLLVGVAKLIAGMSWGDMGKAAIGITGLVGIVALLMKATAMAGENADKVGGTILKVSIAMGILVGVAKLIAGMSWDDMGKAAVGLGGLVGIIAALMYVTTLAGDNPAKIGGTILGIASAIMVMALVARMVAGMDTASLIKGIGIISLFGLIITGLIAATKLAGPNPEKLGLTILAISVAIGILALVATLLGMVKIENLAKGIIAIDILSSMMSRMIKATREANECKGNLIVMVVAIGIMAAAVAALSFIEPKKLAGATAALSILMGVFALMIASTKFAKNTKSMRKTLIEMVGVILILAGVVAALSYIKNIDAALKASAALALLITSFAIAMAILGHAGKISTTVSKQLGPMLLVVAGLASILGILSYLNVEASIPTAIALGILLNSIASALIIMSTAGRISTTVSAQIGPMLLVVAGLAAILAILDMLEIDVSFETVASLSTLLLSFSAALVILSLIGPMTPAANAAMIAMGELIAGLSVVLLALGGLSKIPGFNELIQDGGNTLSLIGYALGNFVGSIAGGLAAGVTSSLPEIGTNLSQFMTNVLPFIAGVKLVDESVLAGVGILSAAIIALTVADLIAGISSILQFGSSLADLGTELSQFMINALPFITTAAMITPEMLSGVKSLAETILILTAADVIQGLASFLTGGSSLETFAAQLPILGQGLAAFSTSLGAFTEDQLATVNCAANAVKTLAQASSEIPNTGGLLAQLVGDNDIGVFASQFPILGAGLNSFLSYIGTFTDEQVATVNCAAKAIKTLAQASSEIPNSGGLLAQLVGENDLGTFAAQFPILGLGLRLFLDNVGTFTDEQVATVDCAAKAIKALASAASEIPNEGGWVAKIIGENNLGSFAAQFPALGTGLRGFLDNAGTLDESAIDTLTAGANAVKSLASAASTIPNEGGWISKLIGDNSLGTFADNFPKLGYGLAGFVKNIGTFTSAQVSTISAAISAINALANLADSDLKGATKHLSDFGKDLPDFATDLATFCSGMPSTNSVTSAVNNIDRILAAVESIGNANSGVLSNFADNLKKVGKDAVKKFVEAFTSSTAKTDLKSAATTLAGNAVDGASSQIYGMESAGKDLGSGLVRGINAKQTAAYNAGYALGQKAVQGEKDGQKSNSPSKLTIQAGKWLGEGLVIGIKQMGNKVYSAGSNLGSDATKSISNAISNIANFVDSDIDINPTIRPVLDLSDVKSGASSIGRLLGAGSSISLMSDVKSIGSVMNRRSQNGVNDDVISAIDKLRKDVGNISTPSYNIGGITYDDGSNVSEAIKTLIRVAKIERRV